MRRTATIVCLVAAAQAAAPAQGAVLRPRPVAVLVEPAGPAASRLHAEVEQPPGAVRAVRGLLAGRRVALRPIGRRGARTIWHSALLGGRQSAAARSVGRVTLELRLRRGGPAIRRTMRLRLGRRPVPSAAPAPAVPAPVAPGLSAEPAIVPALDTPAMDHVVRCEPAGAVTIEVRDAPAAAPVGVDGVPARTGTFATRVPLAAGQAFTVTHAGRTHHVRCLPAGFPGFTADGTAGQERLHTLITPGNGGPETQFAAVIDERGTPVWWRSAPRGALDLKLTASGDLAWSRWAGGGVGLDPEGAYEIHGLDGSLVRTVSASGLPTDHHEFQELPGGDVLLLGYRARAGADLSPWGGPEAASVLDAVVQQIRPDGSLAWEWDSRDHVALEEGARFFALGIVARPITAPGGGPPLYDTTHANSIEPDGDGLLVSLRTTDAVYRIDRATGAVDWKLGGTATPESLTIVGDPQAAGRFGGQHDARRLPDGTITLFDNGTGRGRAPQALRYAVDPVARTATLRELVAEPGAPASPCCGSARRLPSGRWLVAWGGTPLVTETDAADSPGLRLMFGGPLATYRAVPAPPGVLTGPALRAGMDAMHPRDPQS